MAAIDVPSESLRRVLRYCRAWGVPVQCTVDPLPDMTHWKAWCSGPIFGGIVWPARTIWWPLSGSILDNPRGPHALLHELSHCLQKTHPEDVDEVSSGMLAFEYHSTRWLRISGWRSWIARFGVTKPVLDEHFEWRDLHISARAHVLRLSRRRAVAKGLLTPEGKPTFRNRHRPLLEAA